MAAKSSLLRRHKVLQSSTGRNLKTSVTGTFSLNIQYKYVGAALRVLPEQVLTFSPALLKRKDGSFEDYLAIVHHHRLKHNHQKNCWDWGPDRHLRTWTLTVCFIYSTPLQTYNLTAKTRWRQKATGSGVVFFYTSHFLDVLAFQSFWPPPKVRRIK